MILHGDCLHVLRDLPDNSVDSIVTDPPYGLSFMGKKWDYDVPSEDIWRECVRVLKPGGHLLAFAGTRTQHRMAVRIEDAGFEIRDMIAWVYGSGFPKSLDISKALDKAAGAEREVVGYDAARARPNRVGKVMGEVAYDRSDNGATLTAPATPEAQQWAGWGTALKPALEPITVARKPLTGTVAANVQQWGTGGLNIDGCRVEAAAGDGPLHWSHGRGMGYHGAEDRGPAQRTEQSSGRWPANLIHDGSDEVVALFPESKGQQGDVRGTEPSDVTAEIYGKFKERLPSTARGDTGSAARFFASFANRFMYCAKASKADRNEGLEAGANGHPTIKPTDLMRYLCRLVTPPGGVVLDPFCGSGSTGKAAALEGFGFIGIEREEAYVKIARVRFEHARESFARQQEAAVREQERLARQPVSLFEGAL